MTASQLAHHLAVHPETLGRWERGQSKLPPRHLPTLEHILGCDLGSHVAEGSENVAEDGVAYGIPVHPLVGPAALSAPEQVQLPPQRGTQFLVALTVDELRIIALYRDGRVRIDQSSDEDGR